MREISGLYHIQIDRKFIIVAIKRLLHQCGERGATPLDHHADLFSDAAQDFPVGRPKSVAGWEQQQPTSLIHAEEENKIADEEDHSHVSSGSTNWASDLSTERKIQLLQCHIDLPARLMLPWRLLKTGIGVHLVSKKLKRRKWKMTACKWKGLMKIAMMKSTMGK
jgi:hypothetical protein